MSEVTFKGWLLVGQEPYTRRDGSGTQLAVWVRPCAECLGTAVAKTPVAGYETSKAFGRKRCAACAELARSGE